MTVSIVIMQASLSFIAMYVTVSSNDLFLTDSLFHKDIILYQVCIFALL